VKTEGSRGNSGGPFPAVSTGELMRDIERAVRDDRRTRLVARGGASEYKDEQLFTEVESLLRRALEERDRDVLLLPDLLADEDEWLLQTHLRFSSHRPVIGRFVVALKRRVLLPILRWLYEYSLENFRRQQRVNRLIFACLEELAIENAKLRIALTKLQHDRPVDRQEQAHRPGDAAAGSR
jgi:hypothetical protein